MAYIPDDAIEDAPSLTSPAWLLYCNFCRRRNHQTGRVIFSFSRTQNIMGTSRASLYRALKELIDKGWVLREDPHVVVPVYGNFAPVNKRFELSQKWDKTSQFGDTKSQKMRHAYKEEPDLFKPDIVPMGKKSRQKSIKAEENMPELALPFDCESCEDSGVLDRYPDDASYHADRWGLCTCVHAERYKRELVERSAQLGVPVPEWIGGEAAP
jgi:hypothetical protein